MPFAQYNLSDYFINAVVSQPGIATDLTSQGRAETEVPYGTTPGQYLDPETMQPIPIPPPVDSGE